MRKNLPEFDLDSYLPYQFSVISSYLSNNLATQYRERHGISVPEWRILVNLAYSDSLSVRDIQWRVSMDKSKISRAVTRLDSAGYLTKRTDPGDRRLLELALTEKGYELVADLVPIAKRFQGELQERLSTKFAPLKSALDDIMKEIEK